MLKCREMDSQQNVCIFLGPLKRLSKLNLHVHDLHAEDQTLTETFTEGFPINQHGKLNRNTSYLVWNFILELAFRP